MANTYPSTYVDNADAGTKFLNIVVTFDGTPVSFSLVDTFKKIRFGDPDIHYGDPGLIWGGLKKIDSNLSILSPNTNLTISQKIEPEQGRGSAATMNLEFIDKDGFMTQFVTPGKYLDEILGGKEVKVYLGYQNSSFKEDYLIIFRGYVTAITGSATRVTLQLTDANSKRRAQIFNMGQSKTFNPHTNTFSAGNISLATNQIAVTAHGFKNRNRIQLSTVGVLPSGVIPPNTAATQLQTDTDYFIIFVDVDHFKLSATFNGQEIDFTNQGSGVTTVTLAGFGIEDTSITVEDASNFLTQILGPDGLYDSSIHTYIRIDDEVMEYAASTGLTGNTFTVTRGAFNSIPADHDVVAATVDNAVSLEGNIIDLALKVMLSGWGGPYRTAQTISSFVETNDLSIGPVSTGFVTGDNIDAVQDLGIAVGDYLTISGATNPGNNGTFTVSGFIDRNGRPNEIVTVNAVFTYESTTSAVYDIRSQYDTLPAQCGAKLAGTDVDVDRWQSIQNQYLVGPENIFRNYIDAPQSGKEYIENEYLLPAGMYSVTRFGRLSCALTKPPLAGDILIVLDKFSVIEPQNATITRSINNRRFFNEVQYYYDYDIDGHSTNKLDRLDTESLSLTGTSSVLPIKAKGLRTDLNADAFIDKRVDFIVKRYRKGAIEITLKSNWKAASLIEVSDVVALYDNGNLHFQNFETGERDLGSQLFEVIQRTIDIKTGTGQITLLSQQGYAVSDRFAGIAPSSLIDVGSTASEIVIKDSFGIKYPFNEKLKYLPIVGDTIRIHSQDYTFDETVQLFAFVAGSNYRIIVNPALSSAPPAGYILDLAQYPVPSSADNAKSKLLFSFIDPTVVVVSGISSTSFTVSAGDIGKFSLNQSVLIHNSDYSIESPEVLVLTIVGTTITVDADLGFTPASGQRVELIGFTDGSGPYRIL